MLTELQREVLDFFLQLLHEQKQKGVEANDAESYAWAAVRQAFGWRGYNRKDEDAVAEAYKCLRHIVADWAPVVRITLM